MKKAKKLAKLEEETARTNKQSATVASMPGTFAAATESIMGVTQDLGGSGFLALSGEMGITDLGGATALSAASTARFDALKLTAGRSDIFTKGDRISIGVGMPVAIASGQTMPAASWFCSIDAATMRLTPMP